MAQALGRCTGVAEGRPFSPPKQDTHLPFRRRLQLQRGLGFPMQLLRAQSVCSVPERMTQYLFQAQKKPAGFLCFGFSPLFSTLLSCSGFRGEWPRGPAAEWRAWPPPASEGFCASWTPGLHSSRGGGGGGSGGTTLSLVPEASLSLLDLVVRAPHCRCSRVLHIPCFLLTLPTPLS